MIRLSGGAASRGGASVFWRDRDYVAWWSGTACSILGSSVSSLAFPLLLLFAAGSVWNAGLIAATGRVGALLTVLVGGTLADRISRRRLLLAASLSRAALMAGVAATVGSGRVIVPLLAALSLLDGWCGGIVAATELPVLRRLVPRESFAARAAQEQGVHQAAQLIAGPLAALLFTAAHWLPFAFDAVSFLAAATGIALIRRPLGPDRTEARPRMISDVRTGIQIVRRDSFLRYMTCWVAGTNMVGSSFILLVIVLLEQQGVGPRGIGVTTSAVVASGVVGSLVTGRVLRAAGGRRVFLVGGWMYVVAVAATALGQTPWQVAAAAAVFVLVSVPTASIWEAYTAGVIPHEFVGRVSAVSAFAAQSLTWVGLLLAGWLSERWGGRAALLAFAALLLAFAFASQVNRALDVLRLPLRDVPEVRPDRRSDGRARLA
jgi:MFS family permease